MTVTTVSTITDACNLALDMLGAKAVLSDYENDTSEEAAACRRHFPAALRSVLAAFDWPFAHARAVLQEVDGAELVDWDHVYAMPTRCVMARRVWPSARFPAADQRVPFAVSRYKSGVTPPSAFEATDVTTRYGTAVWTLTGTPSGAHRVIFHPVEAGAAPSLVRYLQFFVDNLSKVTVDLTGLTLVPGLEVALGVLGSDFTGMVLRWDSGDLFDEWNLEWATFDTIASQPDDQTVIGCDIAPDDTAGSEAPVLEYTDLVDDPADWPPLFVDALVAWLATRLAMPLTVKPELRQFAAQAYAYAMAQAQAAARREGQEDQDPEPAAIRARY